VEGHAQGPGPVVGLDGQTLDVVKVQSRFGGGACDLEDCEVACDPAALLSLIDRGTGDVVCDGDSPRFNALGVQAELRLAEVQDIASVISVAEQNSTSSIGRFGHAAHLASG